MNLHWVDEIVFSKRGSVFNVIYFLQCKLHLQIVHKDTLTKIEAKPKKHGPPRVRYYSIYHFSNLGNDNLTANWLHKMRPANLNGASRHSKNFIWAELAFALNFKRPIH